MKTAFPKPGATRKAVQPLRIYRDGREVIRTSTRIGRQLYELRKRIMWERQGRYVWLADQQEVFEEADAKTCSI